MQYRISISHTTFIVSHDKAANANNISPWWNQPMLRDLSTRCWSACISSRFLRTEVVERDLGCGDLLLNRMARWILDRSWVLRNMVRNAIWKPVLKFPKRKLWCGSLIYLTFVSFSRSVTFLASLSQPLSFLFLVAKVRRSPIGKFTEPVARVLNQYNPRDPHPSTWKLWYSPSSPPPNLQPLHHFITSHLHPAPPTSPASSQPPSPHSTSSPPPPIVSSPLSTHNQQSASTKSKIPPPFPHLTYQFPHLHQNPYHYP